MHVSFGQCNWRVTSGEYRLSLPVFLLFLFFSFGLCYLLWMVLVFLSASKGRKSVVFSHSRQLTEDFRRMGSSLSHLRFLPAEMNETWNVTPSWFTSQWSFRACQQHPQSSHSLRAIEPWWWGEGEASTAGHPAPETLPDPSSSGSPKGRCFTPESACTDYIWLVSSSCL